LTGHFEKKGRGNEGRGEGKGLMGREKTPVLGKAFNRGHPSSGGTLVAPIWSRLHHVQSSLMRVVSSVDNTALGGDLHHSSRTHHRSGVTVTQTALTTTTTSITLPELIIDLASP